MVENQEGQREFVKKVKLAASNIVNKDRILFGDNFMDNEWNYYDLFDFT